MAVYKRGGIWWYKFNWNAESIRESTKQSNKRVAEQMEAAHRTALAKGEVGIRDRKLPPSLTQFAQRDFLPFVRSTFKEKVKTRMYYEYGVKSLLAYSRLAEASLDAITTETISGYVSARQQRGLEVSSINRELQVLRRMFHLAQEWEKVEKALPRVKMLPGERHKERVLTSEEEELYFTAAKSEAMQRHQDPQLLHDVAGILIDCGLRPEECFRLRTENVRDGVLEVPHGKSENARRRIPVTPLVSAILNMRLEKSAGGEWVFPAKTLSGHIEPSSLKKQHTRALRVSGVEPFDLYTLRHTCLTRWAPHMDPWTLAYLAGHRDMNITKRYVHPQEHTIREAMEKARNAQGGHKYGHTGEKPYSGTSAGVEAIN